MVSTDLCHADRSFPLLKSRGVFSKGYLCDLGQPSWTTGMLWQLMTTKVSHGPTGTGSGVLWVNTRLSYIIAHIKESENSWKSIWFKSWDCKKGALSPLEFVIKPKLLLFIPQSLCNVGAKLCLFSITAAAAEQKKMLTRLLGSTGSLDALSVFPMWLPIYLYLIRLDFWWEWQKDTLQEGQMVLPASPLWFSLRQSALYCSK